MSSQDIGSVAIVRRQAPSVPHHLRKVLSLRDFEALARWHLP